MSAIDTSPEALLDLACWLDEAILDEVDELIAETLRAVATEKEAASRNEPRCIPMTPGPIPAWSLVPVQGVRP